MVGPSARSDKKFSGLIQTAEWSRSSWTTGERCSGCSKSLSSKAAADESTGGVAPGYVEDAFEARTMPGNGCVSARWGWAGENSDCFSILLVE